MSGGGPPAPVFALEIQVLRREQDLLKKVGRMVGVRADLGVWVDSSWWKWEGTPDEGMGSEPPTVNDQPAHPLSLFYAFR